MAPKSEGQDHRRFARLPIAVSCRLVPQGRGGEAMDGLTIDVSANGLGVKMKRRARGRIDDLLEQLVEDRLTIQVVLRLPEGSVAADGQLMWWGLLGDQEGFEIRAGVLLLEGWSPADWQLIEKSIHSA